MASSAVYLNPILRDTNTIPSWSYSASASCHSLAGFGSVMPPVPPASPLKQISKSITKEHLTSANSVQNNSTLQKSSSDPKYALSVQEPQQPDVECSRSESPKPNGRNKSYHKAANTTMCHVCDTVVRKEYFKHHLFFGAIECSKCGLVWDECKKFVSTDFVNSGCHHVLEYKSDPFEFISSKLSGGCDYDNEELLEPNYVLLNLAKYIQMLSILEDKPPWRDAIQRCRDNLPVTPCTINDNLSTSKTKNPEGAHSNGSDDGDGLCLNTTNNSLSSEGEGDLSLVHLLTRNVDLHEEPIFDLDSEVNENDTDALEHVLLQAYDLEALDQTIEYVEVASNKTIKAQVLSEPPKELPSTKKRTVKDIELDPFLGLPGDGKYLILDKSIEECPLCYTSLCPSRFSVNVESFLVTTVCIGCDLSIYFVVSPNVSIVTDADAVSLCKLPVPSQKKKKNRSGRRSASKSRRSIRATDFFAK